MNKEYIEELSIKRYKRNLNSVIDTLIKPYLNAKTNKISKHKPSIVISFGLDLGADLGDSTGSSNNDLRVGLLLWSINVWCKSLPVACINVSISALVPASKPSYH